MGKSYLLNTVVLSSLSPEVTWLYTVGMCSWKGCGFGAVLSEPRRGTHSIHDSGGGGSNIFFWVHNLHARIFMGRIRKIPIFIQI